MRRRPKLKTFRLLPIPTYVVKTEETGSWSQDSQYSDSKLLCSIMGRVVSFLDDTINIMHIYCYQVWDHVPITTDSCLLLVCVFLYRWRMSLRTTCLKLLRRGGWVFVFTLVLLEKGLTILRAEMRTGTGCGAGQVWDRYLVCSIASTWVPSEQDIFVAWSWDG